MSQALRYLNRRVARGTLDSVERAALDGYIAKGYFNAGKNEA